MAQQIQFKPNNYVVYPTHGVGKITGIEEQEISGMRLRLKRAHVLREIARTKGFEATDEEVDAEPSGGLRPEPQPGS